MEADRPSRAQVQQYYRESIFNRQTLRTIWTVLLYTLVILAPGYLLSFISHLV
ncbi:MAG: hypothetical protein JNM63_00840 [Spirochaetia bacterium]|nr:hypothetical protein [Spirochaetia bacterium]